MLWTLIIPIYLIVAYKIRIKIIFDNEISMIFSYHCYSVAKILRLGIEKDSCSFCLTVSVIFHHNIGYIDVILCSSFET